MLAIIKVLLVLEINTKFLKIIKKIPKMSHNNNHNSSSNNTIKIIIIIK